VPLRPPIYTVPARHRPSPDQARLAFVTAGDAHQIRHLREKGYVERPARVQSIRKGIESIPLDEFKIKAFAEKHILRVHHPDLVNFLKQGGKHLDSVQLLYPNVFPIRRPDRILKAWDMRAGYYCIDTFTPVTANAYQAARNAVNVALTGAERIAKGATLSVMRCVVPRAIMRIPRVRRVLLFQQRRHSRRLPVAVRQGRIPGYRSPSRQRLAGIFYRRWSCRRVVTACVTCARARWSFAKESPVLRKVGVGDDER